jgi:hypothetical protein
MAARVSEVTAAAARGAGNRRGHGQDVVLLYGRVERAILHALREQRGNRGIFHLEVDAKELAHYIIAGEAVRTVDDPTYYRGGYTPTRSEVESVRRALRNLRKKGLVYAIKYPRRVYYQQPGKKPNTG